MKKYIFLLILSTQFLFSGNKVLYVTLLPGKWHDYKPQLNVFKKEIASSEDWKIRTMSGSYDKLLKKLGKPNFSKGYDVLVYNFCLAKTKNLDVPANIIKQTREYGVPAMFIHCSMHSFWATYKPGKGNDDSPNQLGKEYKGGARPEKVYVQQWKKANPNKPFPAWGDFTGVASTKHGPRGPIKILPLATGHPAIKSISQKGYETGSEELYNNFYVIPEVKPLLKGVQMQLDKKIAKKIERKEPLTEAEKKTKSKRAEAIVMWEVPQGKSLAIGLSLGHYTENWKEKEFQALVKDSVNYLLTK